MNETTTDKMRKMKFHGMLREFKSNLESNQTPTLTADELVANLIDAEWDDRHNRSIQRSLHNARFRYRASIEQIEYNAERTLDKNMLLRLSEGNYIEKKENIFITGSTGLGKSYIASALGNQACTQGYKVMYFNTAKLFSKLKMAKADGTYITEMAKIERQDLLIIDDFGISPMDSQGRAYLLEIIEDRHGKRSMIMTSQLPVSRWYDVIGEQTIADAILDRIVHEAHRIEIEGESMRRKKNAIEPSNELEKLN
jgi:DNA replication protein DnaC